MIFQIIQYLLFELLLYAWSKPYLQLHTVFRSKRDILPFSNTSNIFFPIAKLFVAC